MTENCPFEYWGSSSVPEIYLKLRQQVLLISLLVTDNLSHKRHQAVLPEN